MPESVTFDHYTVLQRDDGSLYELGRGAMGITYKAFDTNLRIPVALKVINGAFLHSEIARQRFVREARAAAKLRHRHVASVFHLAAEGDTMFYAMEFIDGETVDALIKRQGPLAPLLALQIVDQVARALNAAQVHGLVHRDIKPANLMLIREDDELTVKVIDFGLAKTLTPGEEDAATISQGGFVGTPHFASPEQLEEREIDVRSDIYSLGITLWYMLAGQTPFAGSMAQVMSQHLAKAPPFERLASIPPPVAALLRKMLEKDRATRPQTPSELRQEIEKCCAQVRGQANGALAASGDPEDYATVLEEAPTRPTDTKFDVGAVVADRYRIAARLGDTNTGVVFRADRTAGGEPVRLLVLHRELMTEPATAAQIEREVEKVAPVQHPNLLRVFAIETVDGASFITLEWTEGFSLLEVLRARRELEAVEVLKLLGQAADGVDHALAAGLKRLDLALHQVFIHFSAPFDKHALLHHPITQWPAFVLKLNPLGITRDLSASETWSGQQTMVGRPANSSAALGEHAHTIQGLGSLVYELLGGALSPVSSGADLGSHYTPLANLSEQGNEALRHALAPNPPYRKAYEFYRALAEVDDVPTDLLPLTLPALKPQPKPQPKPAPRPPVIPQAAPPPLPPHSMPSRSGAPLAIAALLVALVLLGGGIYFFVLPIFHQPTPEPQPGPSDNPVVVVPDEPPTVPPENPQKPEEPRQPPPPSRVQMLKVAASTAETLEASEDWPAAVEAWLKIAGEFPESDAGKVRMEMIIERLRARSPEINTQELPALRDRITAAAKLDVLAAMMFLAENLRADEPTESFFWYSAAAARGEVSALTMTGLMLSNGYGCERDLEKALAALRAAVEKGHPPAKTALADCYLHGTNVPRDPKKAVELLREAVEGGNARGMDMLATCYNTGEGVPANPEEAFRLYTRAVELGFNPALGNLAVMHINPKGGRRPDLLKAIELLQKGIRTGDAYCLYLYAVCLETGTGVKPDPAKAREFYKRSAEAGHPKAQDWCKEQGIEIQRPTGPFFTP